MEAKRISRQSLTRKVGHGSSRQDFVGEFLIILLISSLDTGSNIIKGGGMKDGAILKFPVRQKLFRIVVILSEKKSTNLFARPLADSCGVGSVGSVPVLQHPHYQM